MKTSDWDDPEIRAVGLKYASESYDLASELRNFGADAAQLLVSYKEQKSGRPEVRLPPMLADAVMAVLLALPRPEWAPDRPLGENVTALRKRRREDRRGQSQAVEEAFVGEDRRRDRLGHGDRRGAWTAKVDIAASRRDRRTRP